MQIDDPDDGFDQFHSDLYRIARRELSRMLRSGTLDTVALVNETYMRLADRQQEWESKAHFIASVTQTMRRLLIDHIRKRQAQRHGGDWVRVTTARVDAGDRAHRSPSDLLLLDQALRSLGAMSPRLETVFELKCFGGLTSAEIADQLDISTATVTRELRAANAFLSSTIE